MVQNILIILCIISLLECFSFDLEAKTVNQTQAMSLSFDWFCEPFFSYCILKHVHLTPCFPFDFDLLDSVHTEQSCVSTDSERTAKVCKSFVTGQMNYLT